MPILFCYISQVIAVNIFCRLPEWIRNVQIIPGFSTRLGWEHGWKSSMAQKTKDWKSNTGTLTFPTKTVNMIDVIELNCKVVKNVATPPWPFPINPPFQIYPPFLAKNFVSPPSSSIFGWSHTPLLPPLISVCGVCVCVCVCVCVWGGGG